MVFLTDRPELSSPGLILFPFLRPLLAKRNLFRRIVTFGLVGVIVNVVYATLFFSITAVTKHRLLAGALSYGTACAVQYCANAVLTFRTKVIDPRQVIRYVVVVALGCAASSVFVADVSPMIGISDVLGLLTVMLSMPVVNFLFFSLWVYRTRAPKPVA